MLKIKVDCRILPDPRALPLFVILVSGFNLRRLGNVKQKVDNNTYLIFVYPRATTAHEGGKITVMVGGTGFWLIKTAYYR